MRIKIILLLLFTVTVRFADAQAWLPCGAGTLGTITSMATDSVNNRLFVSGNFTDMDGMLVNHIAIWNGTNWSTFIQNNNGNIGMTNTVSKLLVWNNYLYMVMNNGGPGQSIYRTPLDSFVIQLVHSFNGGVADLVVYHDTLYACGDFTGMMSKWTGTNWISVTGGLGSGVGLSLYDMEVYNDKIYVVGDFEITSPYVTKDVAAYNNGVWEDVGNNLVADFGNFGTNVYAIKPYHNKLYIGGEFDTNDGAPGNGLLVLEDSLWSPAEVSGSGIHSMDVYKDKLYLGGSAIIPFVPDHFGCVAVYDSANWNYAFYNGVCAGGGIYSFERFHDKLYVAGNYGAVLNSQVYAESIMYLDPDTVINAVKEIENKNIAGEIRIYPNPSNEKITAEWNGIANEIELKDLLGRIVLKQSVTPAERSKELKIANLNSGFYLLTVKTVTGSKTVKVVKE